MLESVLKDPKYTLPFWLLIPLLIVLFYIEMKDKLHLGEIFNLPKELRRFRMERHSRRFPPCEGTFIGVSSYKDPVTVPDNAKHVFVCGTTGSGKTVALANFISRAVEQNFGLLIVDGKGDIGKSSILELTAMMSRGKRKLYVINLNHPEMSDKYNPFRNAAPTVVKDMLVNMTEWSEEHYKYNSERYLQRLVKLLHMSGVLMSFKGVTEFMPPARFTKLSADLSKSGAITKEEHVSNVELANVSGKIIEGASARFSTLLESELGRILDADGVDIYGALSQNAVIIFILNPLIYPELTPVFGKLLLIDSKKAVNKLFGDESRKFFVYDEISTYAGTQFLDLVNKSRSANVTCVLASQSLSDLDAVSEHYKEQIIENCNHYIILRQNSSVNAEKWANILGTRRTLEPTYQLKHTDYDTTETGLGSLRRVREYLYHPDDIKSMKTGEAVYMSKDDGYHGRVFINKPF